MYEPLTPDQPISQGDIIDHCPIFGLDSKVMESDPEAQPARWDTRIIVLTQACDLAQAKTTRVLVALVHAADLLVQDGVLKASFHPRSDSARPSLRLVLPSGRPRADESPGIDRRSARPAHGPAGAPQPSD